MQATSEHMRGHGDPGGHEHGAGRHAPGHAGHGAHRVHATGTAPGSHAGHSEHAHDKHAGHDPEQFRRRFWVALALTIPTVLYSASVQDWLGFTPPSFPGSGRLPAVLGTAVFAYGGEVFLRGAWYEVRDRAPGMMLLVAMAISVAFGASAAAELDAFEMEFWWELAALVTVMLLGHWQEMRAIGQARGALAALAELLPDRAERITGDTAEMVPLFELQVGDVVLVRPGGRVPADGEVIDGAAEVDESMITGESRPVLRTLGDRVVAGSVSTDSPLRVRITAVGEETALAGIRRLVEDAQASRSRAQALADRAAALLFYVAVGAAAVTATGWTIAGDTREAIERTVTVLVIACPHALGLAIPLVIALSTGISARAGILVKDRLALERMRDVDVVLFDKTGTLTTGQHEVVDAALAGVGDVGDLPALLRLAGAVEAESEHPLARAVVRAAREHGALPRAAEVRALTGRGIVAEVAGREVAVGGPALLREWGLDVPAALEPAVARWRGDGTSILYVVRDREVVGALALEDAIRPEAAEAVRALHGLGVAVAMITGDARQVAEHVAAELGIDEVFAEVLPEHKDAKVAELQARGLRVAMVGDGVNDAPALARADVGIAIGAGTDVAIESAGVVLASGDPRGVLGVVRLSRASYRKMVQNLVWAAGYNVAAIPLAAGALAFAGVEIAPAVGAVLMSVSTIVVALNAQLLRRLDLRPARS